MAFCCQAWPPTVCSKPITEWGGMWRQACFWETRDSSSSDFALGLPKGLADLSSLHISLGGLCPTSPCSPLHSSLDVHLSQSDSSASLFQLPFHFLSHKHFPLYNPCTCDPAWHLFLRGPERTLTLTQCPRTTGAFRTPGRLAAARLGARGTGLGLWWEIWVFPSSYSLFS